MSDIPERPVAEAGGFDALVAAANEMAAGLETPDHYGIIVGIGHFLQALAPLGERYGQDMDVTVPEGALDGLSPAARKLALLGIPGAVKDALERARKKQS